MAGGTQCGCDAEAAHQRPLRGPGAARRRERRQRVSSEQPAGRPLVPQEPPEPQRNVANRGHGNRRAPARFPRLRRRGDEAARARGYRWRRGHARVDHFARHDPQVHAHAARSLRAEVLLLKPCRYRDRRRSVEYRYPRPDQESRRRREPEPAVERQPDRVHVVAVAGEELLDAPPGPARHHQPCRHAQTQHTAFQVSPARIQK